MRDSWSLTMIAAFPVFLTRSLSSRELGVICPFEYATEVDVSVGKNVLGSEP